MTFGVVPQHSEAVSLTYTVAFTFEACTKFCFVVARENLQVSN